MYKSLETYKKLYPTKEVYENGELKAEVLNEIQQPYISGGGVFSRGLDLLTEEFSESVVYKPNTPRRNIRFEYSDLKMAYIPEVSIECANNKFRKDKKWKNFKKYYNNTDGIKEFCAWKFAKNNVNVPINITTDPESACKLNDFTSGMSLSVTNLHRTLNPKLEVLLSEGRTINLYYEQQDGIKNSIIKTGKEIEKLGCKVNVACWESSKALTIGDLIDDKQESFNDEVKVYTLKDFEDLELIEVQKYLNCFTYKPDILLNTKYIPKNIVNKIPQNGIFCLKSPKSSGKSSSFLKPLVRKNKVDGKLTISITSRKALGKSQAADWDMAWIEDVKNINKQRTLVVCWDSVHKLEYINCDGATIIIDEAELGLKHHLTSDTCKEKREKIIEVRNKLLKTVLSTNGRLILADADLSDLTVNHFSDIEPDAPIFTILNESKNIICDIDFHTGKKEKTLSELLTHVENGEKVLVSVDSQKEGEAIEKLLKSKFSSLTVERVDSKTTPTKKGGKWIINADKSIKETKPDVLIYSPSMGVGVSIESEYFDICFALYCGVLTPSEARQSLFRDRSSIKRIVFCKDKGILDTHKGFTPKQVLSSLYHDIGELDLDYFLKSVPLEQVREVLIYSDMIESGKYKNCDNIKISEIIARDNYAKSQLALQLMEELKEEGHNVVHIDDSDSDCEDNEKELQMAKEEIREEEAESVADADDISIEAALEIKNQNTSTEEEVLAMKKAFLRNELPCVDLTSDLIYEAVVKNKKKTLNANKLFFLLNNPKIAEYLDFRKIDKKINAFSNTGVMLTDLNLYSSKVKLLQKLDILRVLQLSNTEKTFIHGEDEVEEFRGKCWAFRKEIRTVFGYQMNKKIKPIQLLKKFANYVGIDLCSERTTVDKKRIRIYKVDQDKLNSTTRIKILRGLDRKGHEYVKEACYLNNEFDYNFDIPKVFEVSAGLITKEEEIAESFAEKENVQTEESNIKVEIKPLLHRMIDDLNLKIKTGYQVFSNSDIRLDRNQQQPNFQV